MNKQNELINKFYEIVSKHLNESKESKNANFNFEGLHVLINKYYK